MIDSALITKIETSRLRHRLPTPIVRRQLRQRAEISQTAIAEAVEVDRATVSRWEAGSRTPSGENLVRYLEVLDLLRLEGGS